MLTFFKFRMTNFCSFILSLAHLSKYLLKFSYFIHLYLYSLTWRFLRILELQPRGLLQSHHQFSLVLQIAKRNEHFRSAIMRQRAESPALVNGRVPPTASIRNRWH